MEGLNGQQNKSSILKTNNWLKIHGLPMGRERYARRNERIVRKRLGVPVLSEKENNNCFLKKITPIPTGKITVSKEEREQMNKDIGVVLGKSGSGISFASGIVVCHKNKVSFTMYITYYL